MVFKNPSPEGTCMQKRYWIFVLHCFLSALKAHQRKLVNQPPGISNTAIQHRYETNRYPISFLHELQERDLVTICIYCYYQSDGPGPLLHECSSSYNVYAVTKCRFLLHDKGREEDCRKDESRVSLQSLSLSLLPSNLSLTCSLQMFWGKKICVFYFDGFILFIA